MTSRLCELHLHLEGAVRPATLAELARRHGVEWEARSLHADGGSRGLDGFLARFRAAAACLVEADDFERISYEVVEDLAGDGVAYAEITFSPFVHLARGITFDAMWTGISAGLRAAERDLGVIARVIVSINKEASRTDIQDLVDVAVGLDRDLVVGVGAGGREAIGDAARYVDAWATARRAGLRTTFHVGETGSAKDVVDCIRILRPDRLDHCLAAGDSPETIRRIVQDGIPVTTCPSSNLLLAQQITRFDQHPLPRFLDADMVVTLGSDDPTFTGVTLLEELRRAVEAFDLSADQVARLVDNGVEATWQDDETKRWLRSLPLPDVGRTTAPAP